ncbi:MAG: hypothetical protein JSS44_07545 [Proteobacteria bacterium]|nr:hypothetical protein [Pseudomonadota bacterium]
MDTSCPGCGIRLAAIEGPVHRYIESSPACWALYGEVLVREYQDPAHMAVHRLTVDAYAVQHPGRPGRQAMQSVGGHLLSMYAVLELGSSHQDATGLIARAVKQVRFRWLEPPASMGPLTVTSVAQAAGAVEHCLAVQRWAESAWQAWAAHHCTIRQWATDLRQ